MKLQKILCLIICCFILLLIFGCNSESIEQPQCEDCNVILIVIDTLRADHVGAYGYNRDTTPNIDQLAKEGILFKNAFSQSSWTRPSTASILTGLYPKNNGANTRQDRLTKEKVLFSEIVKEEGYSTAAFVTNGNVGPNFGFNQGYDYFTQLRENKSKLSLHAVASEVNAKLIPYIKKLKLEFFGRYLRLDRYLKLCDIA